MRSLRGMSKLAMARVRRRIGEHDSSGLSKEPAQCQLAEVVAVSQLIEASRMHSRTACCPRIRLAASPRWVATAAYLRLARCGGNAVYVKTILTAYRVSDLGRSMEFYEK